MSSKNPSLSFHLSRRQLLKGAGATAGALAAGSILKGSLNTVESLVNPAPVKAASFYKGADISWAQQMAATGYWWRDASGNQPPSGTNADGNINFLLGVLKSYGVNAIRLRTWVNPSSDPVNGHCSQSETVHMAYLCVQQGMAVDIDFHFSDSWADAGHQVIPAAWAGLSYSKCESALGTYVYNFMKALNSAGVTPTWVQLGNEENSGICHPTGSLSNGAQMTGLIMAGYNNVKAVFASAQCIIHLAQPQKTSGVTNMLNAYQSNGGRWDITGFSSYASGGNVPGIISAMQGFQSQYGKPVMQVEFGGPVSKSSTTASSLTAFVQGVRNFGGHGVFYWEPEVYSPFDSYDSGAWETNYEPDTTIMNAMKSA